MSDKLYRTAGFGMLQTDFIINKIAQGIFLYYNLFHSEAYNHVYLYLEQDVCDGDSKKTGNVKKRHCPRVKPQ